MIVGIAVKEGINAWRGNLCCPPQRAGAADTPRRVAKWRSLGSMITVDGSAFDHVELSVSAPLSPSDLTAARASLEPLIGTPAMRRILVVVESVGLPGPKTIWEDLKLARLIRHIRWVALVTDIGWYARLSELSGALLPGLTIKHFEPDRAAAALQWLSARPID
jgi:hypothetical protein